MDIIIPMAGVGQRFIEAGYTQAKPLIELGGRPMIAHVIDMFPGEEHFVFVCNNRHLQETNLRQILLRLKPSSRIIGIDFKKLGPVWGVLQALRKDSTFLNSEEPTVVNYCDFNVWWDYADFKRTLRRTRCDGCVTAYIGFHPHLLDTSKRYAGMRVDKNGWMQEIREKFSFTSNLMDCHQSSGTYYFKKGNYIPYYFDKLYQSRQHVNGEYYVSQVYSLMQKEGLRTYVYTLENFLQWGTPEDVEQYLFWSQLFAQKVP